MRSKLVSVLVLASATAAGAAPLVGQQASQQASQQPASTPNPAGIEVGTLAPDFSLAGATRYGTLRDPVRLADYRGKTVVLAFFYKARTKG
ncbi:MAG TPA: hypothetical protein VNA89_00635 [Gemmatimonadaceae bacterium]|nr:hypothetical protein [Gemmatimonadaceae bacterium]